MIALSLLACANLDAFVFNGVPCSQIGPETCEGKDSAWDALCVVCEQPYDWTRDYPWMDGTLRPDQSIRPVDDWLVTELDVKTEDGEGHLDGVFLAAHGDDPVLARITLLYNHGNYASIEHYQPRIRMLYEAGYNVLAWDYRGYGKTTPETSPTAEQHLSDASLMLAEARRLAPDPDLVIPYGYSLGTITATAQAVEADSCALLLEAPFASMASIANDNTTLSLGEQLFSAGGFDSRARMDVYEGAALGMTGTEDRTAPTEKVHALLERGPGPREVWELPGVHHGVSDGGIPEAGLDDYLDHLRTFLDQHGCL